MPALQIEWAAIVPSSHECERRISLEKAIFRTPRFFCDDNRWRCFSLRSAKIACVIAFKLCELNVDWLQLHVFGLSLHEMYTYVPTHVYDFLQLLLLTKPFCLQTGSMYAARGIRVKLTVRLSPLKYSIASTPEVISIQILRCFDVLSLNAT